jgi:hypothetical protein
MKEEKVTLLKDKGKGKREWFAGQLTRLEGEG